MPEPHIRSTSSRNDHYDVLDGMRGIAAIVVMLCHFSKPCGFTYLGDAGLAVDFFFILSGFVIMHAYGQALETGMKRSTYVARRFIRLGPMFFISLMIGMIVLVGITRLSLTTYSHTMLLRSFIQNLFGIPYLNHEGIKNMGYPRLTRGEIFPSNPPLWSLFFELIASLGFIVFVPLRRLYLGLFSLIMFGILAYNGGDLGGSITDDFWLGFPRVLFAFTLGMLLPRAIVDTCTGGSYLLYALMVLVFNNVVPKFYTPFYQLSVLLIIFPLFIIAGSRINCKGRIERNTARFLGWISYPLYCLHFPVGRAVFALGDKAGYEACDMFWIAISVTLILALLIGKLIDEPCRRFLTTTCLSARKSAR